MNTGKFNVPTLEVVTFAAQDIITTSLIFDENNKDQSFEPWIPLQ